MEFKNDNGLPQKRDYHERHLASARSRKKTIPDLPDLGVSLTPEEERQLKEFCAFNRIDFEQWIEEFQSNFQVVPDLGVARDRYHVRIGVIPTGRLYWFMVGALQMNARNRRHQGDQIV